MKAPGVVAVTCLNAQENAAVLEKPASLATSAIGLPQASCSIALTIRARCLQALSVIPVSIGNRRLAVRTEVAARDANSFMSIRLL